MDDIPELLEQVEYPATRQDLIDAAAASDPSPAIVVRLLALESRLYEDAGDVASDLFGGRAESNASLVTITAEPCEHCGFPRMPHESHSCVEEKALFADSANAMTDEFDRFDESTARQAASEDLRSGNDRRQIDMQVGRSEERRRPRQRRRDKRPSAGG
jgi:hypothetical protein